MTHSYNEKHTHVNHAKAGFTLFEIMIAIAIIGGILAILLPQIRNYLARAKTGTAKTELRVLQQGITLYREDIGRYPTRLRDLIKRPADPAIRAKWQEGGYWGGKKEESEDPWSNRYQYKLTQGGRHPYELYSFGPKGRGAPREEHINVWDL